MANQTTQGRSLRAMVYEGELNEKFQQFSKDEMRVMWDNIGDNSFFGPFDCADIHAYMNLTGDGAYCAV